MHVEEWHLVESHFKSGIIVKPVFLGGIYAKISARRPHIYDPHPKQQPSGQQCQWLAAKYLLRLYSTPASRRWSRPGRQHGQQGDSRGNRLDPDQKAALVAGPAQQRQPTTSWVGPMVAALRSEREALTEEQLDRQEWRGRKQFAFLVANYRKWCRIGWRILKVLPIGWYIMKILKIDMLIELRKQNSSSHIE